MDARSYQEYMALKEVEFEGLCKRCGLCCGSADDPCEKLVSATDGKYYCMDYNNRLGQQRTVSGHVFNCVSIREHISKGTLRPGCAYKGL